MAFMIEVYARRIVGWRVIKTLRTDFVLDALKPDPSSGTMEVTGGCGVGATLTWESWFNHHRLMEPLGYLPPAECEANYNHQQTAQADLERLWYSGPLGSAWPLSSVPRTWQCSARAEALAWENGRNWDTSIITR